MRKLIITTLFLVSSTCFAGGKWFLFTSEVNLDKVTQCHKAGFTTTPGKRMKHFDQMDIQYKIGDEIAIYMNKNDLLEKVKFYLENESLREQIAEDGYKRSMADHTFENRFNEVFKRMEIANEA